MKIGLVTIYSVPNYGSVLQAFATQTLLQKMGHDCRIIDYAYPNEWHYNQGFKRPTLFRRLLNSIMVMIGIKAPYRKQKLLAEFRKKYFRLTPKYADYDQLQREDWNEFDLIAVGSDQVWNPTYHKGDKTFLLSFLPKEKRRISIASSFAITKLPEQYEKKYKEGLKLFSGISVREEDGVKIINQQLCINKNVFVCLDPTLLLSKEDYIHIFQQTKTSKRPYILYYMWGYAFEPRPYIYEVVEYWKRRLGIDEVIALEGYTKDRCEMKNAEDSTIPEFMDYFSNASLVITSSFHGTAFALNFSRPLISIVPNNNYDNRQKNLCQSLGADNCIVEVGQSLLNINPYYDVKKVAIKLEEKRLQSIKWIERTVKLSSN